MRDVMLDIETLGTKAGSVILSIGACGFDRETGEIWRQGFHMDVSIASSLRLGATIDAETVAWWRGQSDTAKDVIWRALAGGTDLPDVLVELGRWISVIASEGREVSATSRVRIWGNGSDFDNVLIAAACRQAGQSLPWNTFNNRCFRTLKDDHRDLEPVREGTHHDALDDAIHQARWACAIFQKLKRARDLTAFIDFHSPLKVTPPPLPRVA